MNTKPTIKNFIIVILPAILALFIIFFIVMPKIRENREKNNQLNVANFEECVAAGNPIMESFPRQCATPDGKVFVEETEEVVGGDQDEHGCLGPAGYSWCEAKDKCLRIFEEFCPDGTVLLADEIKKTSGVSLKYSGETVFNWIANEGENTTDVKITGVLYSAENVKMADYEKIEKYMNDNFELSSYNLADGLVGGLRGYYGNYAVCLLNFRHSQMQENKQGLEEPVGDNLNIKIECGYFNKNNISEIIAERLIAEELAKKYQKAIEEVNIEIIKKDDTHAAGKVVFSQGGEGEAGMFLAFKSKDKWQIVFDGNGSVDCYKMKQEYQFSDEILKPNFCD